MKKLQFLHSMVRSPYFAGSVLVALCVTLEVLGDPARELLRYERAGLIAGELWRIVTGHLVHLGPAHAGLNLLAFALIGWLFCDQLKLREWVVSGLIAAVCIAFGLYLFSANVLWYVGLSGILHGWFGLGAIRLAERSPRLAAGMLLGLGTKLCLEQLGDAMPFTAALDIGPVVVDAHLYGAIGAGLSYVILRIGHRSRRSRL